MAHVTFCLMAKVMFTLSLTIYEKFENKIKYQNLTWKLRSKVEEKNGTCAFQLEMLDPIQLNCLQFQLPFRYFRKLVTNTHTKTHTARDMGADYKQNLQSRFVQIGIKNDSVLKVKGNIINSTVQMTLYRLRRSSSDQPLDNRRTLFHKGLLFGRYGSFFLITIAVAIIFIFSILYPSVTPEQPVVFSNNCAMTWPGRGFRKKHNGRSS